MLLSRFARFALGLYSPFTPDDLRLTDVEPSPLGVARITSKVGMSDHDHKRQEAYQQQQHATRDQLQDSVLAREIAEMEQAVDDRPA
jgi:hypothetical protein